MRIKGAMTILKKRAKVSQTTEELVQWLDDGTMKQSKCFSI